MEVVTNSKTEQKQIGQQKTHIAVFMIKFMFLNYNQATMKSKRVKQLYIPCSPFVISTVHKNMTKVMTVSLMFASGINAGKVKVTL